MTKLFSQEGKEVRRHISRSGGHGTESLPESTLVPPYSWGPSHVTSQGIDQKPPPDPQNTCWLGNANSQDPWILPKGKE